MMTILMSYMLLGHVHYKQITTDRLLDAIAIVESNGGTSSKNVYQLTPIYVRDVVRISRQRMTFAQATGSEELARACIECYWDYYGKAYTRKTGRAPSAEVLVRIHNGGPDGWQKRSTVKYWRRVQEVLDKGDVK